MSYDGPQAFVVRSTGKTVSTHVDAKSSTAFVRLTGRVARAAKLVVSIQ